MINKNNVLQRGMKTRKVGFEEFNTIQESYKYVLTFITYL